MGALVLGRIPNMERTENLDWAADRAGLCPGTVMSLVR